MPQFPVALCLQPTSAFQNFFTVSFLILRISNILQDLPTRPTVMSDPDKPCFPNGSVPLNHTVVIVTADAALNWKGGFLGSKPRSCLCPCFMDHTLSS